MALVNGTSGKRNVNVKSSVFLIICYDHKGAHQIWSERFWKFKKKHSSFFPYMLLYFLPPKVNNTTS